MNGLSFPRARMLLLLLLTTIKGSSEMKTTRTNDSAEGF